MISIDKGLFTKMNKSRFEFHCFLNIALITCASLIIILAELHLLSKVFQFLCVPLILAFLISELFKTASLTDLLVCLENERKIPIYSSLGTFFLFSNPLIGTWNLHKRLKGILIEE